MRPTIVVSLMCAFLLSFLAVACSGDSGGSPSTNVDPLEFLPDDFSEIEEFAVDRILGGDVPKAFEENFEEDWSWFTAGDALTIDDVDHMVRALDGDRAVVIARGSLDFGAIRDWAAEEEETWGRASYQGEEFWESEAGAMVLLEEDGYMVYGVTDLVKDILKVRNRGTGSLAENPDSKLMQVLDSASGWYVRAAEDDCGDAFSSELRSCEAYSISATHGDESYIVSLTHRFLFRTERRAEDAEFEIEDMIEERLGRWGDLEDIRTSGTFVEVRSTSDEEDFQIRWLRP